MAVTCSLPAARAGVQAHVGREAGVEPGLGPGSARGLELQETSSHRARLSVRTTSYGTPRRSSAVTLRLRV